MRIRLPFGREINIGRPVEVPDEEINEPTDAKATPTEIVSTIRSKQLVYNTSGRSTDFQEPDYNLTDVAAAIDTETYFRIAVDKFVNEIWKNGWSFVGKDNDAVAYVKRRFHQISMVADQPTDDLFEDIARQIVTYGNAFVEKRRSDNASGGRRWTRFDGVEFIPIAGLFALDATSMEIARADNGKPLRYRQVIPNPNRQYPEWPAADMLHMHYARQRGLAFGTPFVIPTLDDIRALRSMEQNIEILVFQHAVPLYLYKVGTPENPVQEGEIEYLKGELQEMPKHGVLIVSERHSVEAIGAQGEAINAGPYLEYFKNRVLSGLRLGAVVVGEGGTANRSTASTINAIVQDVAQAFQKRIKIFIDLLIAELLAEGGFEWDSGQYDRLVELFIPEIDIDKKLAMENHYTQLWEQNAITSAELRRAIGKDPFSDEEWKDTFWELIGMPKALIQSLDEQYVKQGANKGSATSTASAKTKKTSANRSKPANQSGKRSSPKLNRDFVIELLRDRFDMEDVEDVEQEDKVGKSVSEEHISLLEQLAFPTYHGTLFGIYNDMKRDLVDRMEGKDEKMLEGTLATARTAMNDALNTYVRAAFHTGALSAGYVGDSSQLGMHMLMDSAVKDISRLIKDVEVEVKRYYGEEGGSLKFISRMEALAFRTEFIARAQLMNAYNQGVAKASMSFRDYKIQVIRGSRTNDGCKAEEVSIDLNHPEAMANLPPFHPNCTCKVQRMAQA